MRAKSASVTFLNAAAETPVEKAEPAFVETSIARQLLSRLALTHEERGISVFSGPWGIGKTTTLDHFALHNWPNCAIVKINPSNSKRGATPTSVLQLAIEALCPLVGRPQHLKLNNAYWALRMTLHNVMDAWLRDHWGDPSSEDFEHELAKFTFIFDEAQYLSSQAIEELRYWNDHDRCAMPIPCGLVFVGNNEFALQEDASGNSVLSGAVRSRALFIESLEYADVSDADLTLFLQSKGIDDPGAIDAVLRHFSSPRHRRDLRNVDRLIGVFKRRAGNGPVTAAVIRETLSI